VVLVAKQSWIGVRALSCRVVVAKFEVEVEHDEEEEEEED